jgi:5-(carboxyamino)imidazole ribonucleotide mutase
VATVAIDGAVNAALLAAQIIGVADLEVRERLRQFKKGLAEGLKL